MLKWNETAEVGLETCQEVAGKCLPAECSTAGLHLERRSDCMSLYCTESAHLLFRTSWCRWELVQGRLQQVWRQDHFGFGTTSGPCCKLVIVGVINWDLFVESGIRTVLTNLTKLLQHDWHTGCPSVITTGETCRVLLNRLIDVTFYTVVPYWWCVLQLRSHKCFVTLLMDVGWAAWEVSCDEVEGLICFLCCVINVVVPCEFVAYVDTKVLGRSENFEIVPWTLCFAFTGLVFLVKSFPSVFAFMLWHCWLGIRNSIWPVKI